MILGRIAVGAFCLIACIAMAAPEEAGPAQVLLINSFSRENSPYEVFASLFRSELAQHVPTPIAFYDTSLDGARFDPTRDTEPFVRFLHDRFAAHAPDLVVPIGPLAARFYTQNRARLFPDAPMLIVAGEQRMLKGVALGSRDAGIAVHLDIPRRAHVSGKPAGPR